SDLLFYVAATRARQRLVVTAVKAPADDGDQPSRFLTELGVEPKDVTGRPRRPLSVAALVAELRATTVDPRVSAGLREAAAHRLARLAALADEDGRPLVPSAHPYRWWGMFEPTESKVPLRNRDQPVVLSGSALDQLAHTCALQWFLGREVKADAPATAAQGFGNVVHVLADEVASGHTPADLAVLMERLDSVWNALAFDAPWKSAQAKENARAAPAAPRWPASTTSTSPWKPATTRSASAARWTASRPTATGARTSSTSRPASRRPPPRRWNATPSWPSTSSPCARAPSTRSSTGCGPSRAARNWSTCARVPPAGTAGRPCPRCRRRSRWRGSGSATCSPPPPGRSSTSGSPPAPASTARTAPSARRAAPGRRDGPRRGVPPRHRPALHALRLPRVVQRPAGGRARRGVSRPRARRMSRGLAKPAGPAGAPPDGRPSSAGRPGHLGYRPASV